MLIERGKQENVLTILKIGTQNPAFYPIYHR